MASKLRKSILTLGKFDEKINKSFPIKKFKEKYWHEQKRFHFDQRITQENS